MTTPITTISPESQGFDSTRLALIVRVMKARVDSGQYAGISTLVARRGNIVHFEQTGVRDKATNSPMSRDTIFRIYSMTKPVVCTALMTLFEEGRFLLSDFVSKFIPAFANVKVYGEVLADPIRPITIRDLFTHTSGLTYDFLEDTPVSGMYRAAGIMSNASRSLEAMIGEIARIPLAYQPGSRWHYSVSIDVIAHLIERISSRQLHDFLSERIFKPLGMVDTAFFVPEDKRLRLAAMYGHPDISTHTVSQIVATALAGRNLPSDVAKTYPIGNTTTFARGGHGLFSTSMDYFRFAQMLLNGGELDGQRILAPKTVELIHSNHLPTQLMPFSIAFIPYPGYGFGLGSRVLVNAAESGLPGSAGEFGWSGAANTYYWVDPEKKLIGIFMSQFMNNLEPVQNNFHVLAYQALLD
jgi:CubicO group peptidase (beta-lactamase class C family)